VIPVCFRFLYATENLCQCTNNFLITTKIIFIHYSMFFDQAHKWWGIIISRNGMSFFLITHAHKRFKLNFIFVFNKCLMFKFVVMSTGIYLELFTQSGWAPSSQSTGRSINAETRLTLPQSRLHGHVGGKKALASYVKKAE
jgi:hypothetical protein